MSTGESQSFKPEQGRLPSEQLLAFLRGQFVDAYQKEFGELGRGDLHNHGTFFKQTGPAEDLTRKSYKIILKPPHPLDRPGVYCEVYALVDYGDDLLLVFEAFGARAKHFLVRDFSGEEGVGQVPFRLVDEAGMHDLSIDADELLTRLGRPTASPSRPNEVETLMNSLQDEFDPQWHAANFFTHIRTYNIGAFTE